MKKVILIAVMALMGLTGYAQSEATAVKFGYLSYDAVLQAMPEYAQMQADMALLRQQYEAEQQRVEDDFNKKYEEFLDGQKSFPKTILLKRQTELQDMLNRNMAFKRESQRLLAEAEAEAKAPLQARLAEVLAQMGQERGYAFILNTDQNAAPFINPQMGENVTDDVKALLQ